MKTKFKNIFFILFILVLISFGFIFSRFLFKIENSSQNWKQKLALSFWQSRNKNSVVKDNIVILSIDDLTSFDLANQLGYNIPKWPLKRASWAQVIDFIEKGKPKVLSISVPFKNYEEITLSEHSSDIILSKTLAKYNNIVLASVLSSSYNSSISSSSVGLVDKLENPFRPIRKSLSVFVDNPKVDANITYFSYMPVPNIFVDNAQMGYINIYKSPDFSVRYSRPVSRVISSNSVTYVPSFAFATFLKYIKYDGPIKISNSTLKFSNHSIPVNTHGENLINWNGPSRTYTFIPFSKIIIGMSETAKTFEYNKKTYPVSYFKDKIVIIAPTQTYVNTFKTPVEKEMAGAEIHANIIDNYITDSKLDNQSRRKFVRAIPVYISVLITLAFTLLIVANTLLFRTSLFSFINSAILVFLYISFNIVAFIHPRVRLDFLLVYPLFFMFIALISSYLYVLIIENSRKKIIISTFSLSVSDYILQRLFKNPKNFSLEPKLKKLTVLRADISRFSSFIEKYSEEEVIDKLNNILNLITKKVFKYNGTTDKVVGDSITAYWGDPIESSNDSLSAVKAAVEILKEIEDYNLSLEAEDLKFDIKISVHTGETLVGVVGNGLKNDYSILGDTVNIVNRMDDICSQFNKKLVISEPTYKDVQNFIQADFIGTLKLKGRDIQVGLFSPKLGKRDD